MTLNTSDNDSTESNIENSIKKKKGNPARWNPDGSPNTTYLKAIANVYANAFFKKAFSYTAYL